jgi:hypothetical protein
MRVDENGWLEGGASDPPLCKLPTVRIGRLVEGGPHGLVWHATGGIGGPRFAEGLARKIQTYRRNVDRPVSWHICLARTGEIFQSAPLTVATWHVGRPGIIAGTRFPNINGATIGVEIENAGALVEIRNALYAWPFWADRVARTPDPRCRIASERVERVAGVPYDGFTVDQISSARALVLALTRYRHWGREALSHCHADFAAPTKTDPGALWKAVVLPRLLDEALRLRIEDPDPGALTVVTGAPVFASA